MEDNYETIESNVDIKEYIETSITDLNLIGREKVIRIVNEIYLHFSTDEHYKNAYTENSDYTNMNTTNITIEIVLILIISDYLYQNDNNNNNNTKKRQKAILDLERYHEYLEIDKTTLSIVYSNRKDEIIEKLFIETIKKINNNNNINIDSWKFLLDKLLNNFLELNSNLFTALVDAEIQLIPYLFSKLSEQDFYYTYLNDIANYPLYMSIISSLYRNISSIFIDIIGKEQILEDVDKITENKSIDECIYLYCKYPEILSNKFHLLDKFYPEYALYRCIKEDRLDILFSEEFTTIYKSFTHIFTFYPTELVCKKLERNIIYNSDDYLKSIPSNQTVQDLVKNYICNQIHMFQTNPGCKIHPDQITETYEDNKEKYDKIYSQLTENKDDFTIYHRYNSLIRYHHYKYANLSNDNLKYILYEPLIENKEIIVSPITSLRDNLLDSELNIYCMIMSNDNNKSRQIKRSKSIDTFLKYFNHSNSSDNNIIPYPIILHSYHDTASIKYLFNKLNYKFNDLTKSFGSTYSRELLYSIPALLMKNIYNHPLTFQSNIEWLKHNENNQYESIVYENHLMELYHSVPQILLILSYFYNYILNYYNESNDGHVNYSSIIEKFTKEIDTYLSEDIDRYKFIIAMRARYQYDLFIDKNSIKIRNPKSLFTDNNYFLLRYILFVNNPILFLQIIETYNIDIDIILNMPECHDKVQFTLDNIPLRYYEAIVDKESKLTTHTITLEKVLREPAYYLYTCNVYNTPLFYKRCFITKTLSCYRKLFYYVCNREDLYIKYNRKDIIPEYISSILPDTKLYNDTIGELDNGELDDIRKDIIFDPNEEKNMTIHNIMLHSYTFIFNNVSTDNMLRHLKMIAYIFKLPKRIVTRYCLHKLHGSNDNTDTNEITAIEHLIYSTRIPEQNYMDHITQLSKYLDIPLKLFYQDITKIILSSSCLQKCKDKRLMRIVSKQIESNPSIIKNIGHRKDEGNYSVLKYLLQQHKHIKYSLKEYVLENTLLSCPNVNMFDLRFMIQLLNINIVNIFNKYTEDTEKLISSITTNILRTDQEFKINYDDSNELHYLIVMNPFSFINIYKVLYIIIEKCNITRDTLKNVLQIFKYTIYIPNLSLGFNILDIHRAYPYVKYILDLGIPICVNFSTEINRNFRHQTILSKICYNVTDSISIPDIIKKAKLPIETDPSSLYKVHTIHTIEEWLSTFSSA